MNDIKECKLGHICTSDCQNTKDCPCLAEHDCQIPAEQLAQEKGEGKMILSICCGMPVIGGICQECKENA